jgi:hypothetical protein
MSEQAGVDIVIVNWNGWRDTLECLESIFRLNYPLFRVIVCDNGSDDASVERIVAWASGEVRAPESSPSLAHLSTPPVTKPIACRAVPEDQLDNSQDVRLLVVSIGSNQGFAAACNVGMRHALVRPECKYVWLLNNDTVVEPEALTALVVRMASTAEAGMCGSLLLEYGNPEKVQACGGAYYCPWIGLPWLLGRFRHRGFLPDPRKVEQRLSYISGASMLVSRSFIEEVGPLCEEYFLYFEEVDWAIRSGNRYRLKYAPASVVYHKGGASIGTSSDPRKKSVLCDYYSSRNRLFFTRKYYPHAVPFIYLFLTGALVTRLMLRRWHNARVLVRLMMDSRPLLLPEELNSGDNGGWS